MSFTTLIETAELAAQLGDPDWAILDCRFVLNNPTRGRQKYLEAHIPGALYADLDHDLSAPALPGKTGRHPLPDAATLAATVARWGIDATVQVVAYDDAGGMMAGRLWWLLRWLGHSDVAVLNGDFRAWQREGRPVISGEEQRKPRDFRPSVQADWAVSAEQVLAQLDDPNLKLLDARARDRYRGENETLDPKGGHIPGALSAPFGENLDAEGYFKSAEELRARFGTLVGETPAEQVVLYCGSGVTAAHNQLAMVHAGLGNARLYVGSWSEWITDPTRPIATGDES